MKELLVSNEIVINSPNEVICSLKNEIDFINKINNQNNISAPSVMKCDNREPREAPVVLEVDNNKSSSLENRRMDQSTLKPVLATENKSDKNKTMETEWQSHSNKRIEKRFNNKSDNVCQVSAGIGLAEKTIQKKYNIIIGSNTCDENVNINCHIQKHNWKVC